MPFSDSRFAVLSESKSSSLHEGIGSPLVAAVAGKEKTDAAHPSKAAKKIVGFRIPRFLISFKLSDNNVGSGMGAVGGFAMPGYFEGAWA
ncbi:MAG: hypothetical protein Kow0065_20510 [Methylomicrobium sp.]